MIKLLFIILLEPDPLYIIFFQHIFRKYNNKVFPITNKSLELLHHYALFNSNNDYNKEYISIEEYYIFLIFSNVLSSN